jgi:uncharacterized protein YceK
MKRPNLICITSMVIVVSLSGCASAGKGAYYRTREDAKMIADGAKITAGKDCYSPPPISYITGPGIMIAGTFHMIFFSILPDTITLPADLNHRKKEPNQPLETTTMADTPAASHPSRQP